MSDVVAKQMVHFDPATGAIKQSSWAFAYFEIDPPWVCGELADGLDAAVVKPGVDTVDLSTIEERDDLPPLVKIIQGTRH